MSSSYVLGISGSSSNGGNTEQVLEYTKEIFETNNINFETVNLRELNILPCNTCENCNYKEQQCDQQDDMAFIINKMVNADGIIYATPVQGFGTSQLMQRFIERAGVGYLRFERPLAKKVGGAIVVGRRYNHSQVYSQLILNMLLNRMIIVGSGFPALIHTGQTNEIFNDLEGMDSIRRMVKSMVQMINVMKMYDLDSNNNGFHDSFNERYIESIYQI